MKIFKTSPIATDAATPAREAHGETLRFLNQFGDPLVQFRIGRRPPGELLESPRVEMDRPH
jgi:hypothetical protein